MAQTHRLELVSFELCPYVERSRIALTEKGLAHDVRFIDLRHKPDWFLALSPMGKVPVLLVDGKPIFESLVINELIEELYPTPPMLPKDPLARAEARAWMIFANDQLMPQGSKAQQAMAVGPVARDAELLAPVRAAFGQLEAQLGRRTGRFFLGDAFGLVDAAYAPFFRRWQAAEGWGGAAILGEFPRLAAYASALLAQPSVVKVAISDLGPRLRAFYAERAAR